MRRFLVLLFLVISSFQLALAGQPAQEAPSRAPQGVVQMDAAAPLMPCVSHGLSTGAEQGSPCQASQPCQACTLCQACQPAAMSGTPPQAAAMSAGLRLRAVVASAYFSAERAPSFKPPIS